jgi:hypothetical protein
MIRTVSRIRIHEAQKHTDPDPQHCLEHIVSKTSGMCLPRPIHWYHSGAYLFWPDGPFM